MVSTFTPNIQLEEPARGDQVGTWDVPVNSNMTVIDKVVGAVTAISLNNANVVLSPAQYQSAVITFNSTLTGNVIVTFPTSFVKSYTIQNLCTGSSAFYIVLGTSGASNPTNTAQFVACPPGEAIDIFNDGYNLKFKNLGRVGSYWDYAGSSVPLWVSTSNPPPYLNCDGSAFNAATFPALATIMGGTTLPDSRGRGRYALNQGTGRVTSGNSFIDGNTRGAAGGSELLQAHVHPNTLTDPGHFHGFSGAVVASNVLGWGGGPNGATQSYGPFNTLAAPTGITINNVAVGGGGSNNMPPTYIGGLTLIRAG